MDDELDARLARMARSVPPVAAGTLDALARDARVEGRLSHRRRLIAGVSGGLLALAAGIIAAPAAADGIEQLFEARTEMVCEGGTECTEGDPIIDLSASDLDELVHALYPDYLELPPGMSRGDLEYAVVDRLAQQNAVAFETEIGHQYENIAYCGWVTEWLAADDAGDSDRRSAAARVMRTAVTWPAMAGSVVDSIWFDQRYAFADAADAGDRAGVRAASSMNICGIEEDKEIRQWLAAWYDDWAAEHQ